MADSGILHHISSAVVTVLPGAADPVLRRLQAMSGVEVHACERGKIIVTLEGTSTGVLGEALSRIALLEGVVSATMVFEHVEELKEGTV